ncbi:hypothetical protein ISS37_09240 [candidate division KSB1 bacterium]|nr:hypothetical protein [candidate division KSB1 bacterium]
MKRIILILITLALCTLSWGQSANVPLQHWVYPYLDRMKTRGIGWKNITNTRPYSRLDVAEILQEIHRQREGLTGVESGQLDDLIEEFYLEWAQISPLPGDYTPQWHLLRATNKEYTFQLDPVWGAKYFYFKQPGKANSINYYRWTNGFKFYGSLKKSLGYYLEARNSLVHGDYEYWVNDSLERKDWGVGWTNESDIKREIYHDEVESYLTFKLPWFRVEFGKDKISWGPGYYGNLLFSQNPTSFVLLKLEARFGRLTYCGVNGALRTDLVDSSRVYFYARSTPKYHHRKKNIAAHRFEFLLSQWLRIGFSEILIYVDRGIEPGYTIPLMILWSQEHYLGDFDNSVIAFDYDLSLLKSTNIYGCLLIDDMTLGKLGTGWFGNKFGYLNGLLWVDPLGIQNTDLRMEYTRLKPYVYTHVSGAGNYAHYNRNLGHWLPPNSDNLYTEFNLWPHHHLRLRASIDLERHGQNYYSQGDTVNVGGDVDFPHRPEDSKTVYFLDGVVERRQKFGLSLMYRLDYGILQDFFINVSYKYLIFENQIVDQSNNTTESKYHQFTLSLDYKF